jgi:DNA-directed RNA polymerase subunit RPC12/RpoP
MKPTYWIKTLNGQEPEFFCPRCGERLILHGGGEQEWDGTEWDGTDEPPDTVTCPECGFDDHIEW